MKEEKKIMLMLVLMMAMAAPAAAGPLTDIPAKEKCRVCGMLVTKYQPWITQIESSNGETVMFDGVKDMMAYYFEPEKYGGIAPTENIYVKDYYTLKYIDGKQAYYVIGSDIMGPMGHELIPFATMAAAENFKKDHHGKMIMAFDDITLIKINHMRSGMQGHKMKHGK